jgi:hypothetical protein
MNFLCVCDGWKGGALVSSKGVFGTQWNSKKLE